VTATAPAVGLENPYVGPRALKVGEPIFGRDRIADNLVDLLVAERIVLLYSPSGAGKTSLIQAGLILPLEKDGFVVTPPLRVGLPLDAAHRGKADWNRYVLSTLRSLDMGAADVLSASQQLTPTTTIAAYLDARRTKRTALRKETDAAASPSSDAQALAAGSEPGQGVDSEILIFDQFEEVLTLDHTDRAAKEEFFRQLGEALRDKHRWALFAIREDYLGAFESYQRCIPGGLSTRVRLDLLDQADAKRAIIGTASVKGVEFTEAAATRVVRGLSTVTTQGLAGEAIQQVGPYVEPVYLQVVCQRLWDHWASKSASAATRKILDSDVDETGDIDTALGDYYDGKVHAAAEERVRRPQGPDSDDEPLPVGVLRPSRRADFPSRVQRIEWNIRQWIGNRLITPEGFRGQVILGASTTKELDEDSIDLLVSAFLVRREKRLNAVWLELAHDRLIEPVRQRNSRWFAQHSSPVRRQAALWDKDGRPTLLLLASDGLFDAQRWAAANPQEVDAATRDFIAASHAQHKRRRNIIIGVGVLVLITGLIVMLSVQQGVIRGAIAARAAADSARQLAEARLSELQRAQSQLGSARDSLANTQAVLVSQFAVDTPLLGRPRPGEVNSTSAANIQQRLQAIAQLERTKSSPVSSTPSAPVTVRYYARDVDAHKVQDALRGLGFRIERNPGLLESSTNAVSFGHEVEEQAKLVAYTLIRAGIEIKRFSPYVDEGSRARLVTVYGVRDLDTPPLTVEQVSAYRPPR
jgi:hypothetical protein